MLKISIYLQSADDLVKNRRTYIWSTNEQVAELIGNLKKCGRIFYSTQYLWDCVGDILIGSKIDKSKKLEEKSNDIIMLYLLNTENFSAEFYTPELLLTLYSQQERIKIQIKNEKEKTNYERVEFLHRMP